MQRALKVTFLILPWLGMAFFAFLYMDQLVTNATTHTYGKQSFDALTDANQKLKKYIYVRRTHKTDENAFKELGLIKSEQYNGKYAPWINTEIGLIKFDQSGFVENICDQTGMLSDPDCPPEL